MSNPHRVRKDIWDCRTYNGGWFFSENIRFPAKISAKTTKNKLKPHSKLSNSKNDGVTG